jgi:hypothetical protein
MAGSCHDPDAKLTRICQWPDKESHSLHSAGGHRPDAVARHVQVGGWARDSAPGLAMTSHALLLLALAEEKPWGVSRHAFAKLRLPPRGR